MTDAQRKMLLDWMRKIHQLEYAHRYESLHWSKRERVIGLSAFIITTVIAFSYRFPSVEPEVYKILPFFLKQSFLVPLASTVVAILTGLQTFQKPSEKSETHKKTASNYEKLRHKIELLLTSPISENLSKKLAAIKDEWESLDSINVSKKYFEEGKQRVSSFNKYHKELDFLPDIN